MARNLVAVMVMVVVVVAVMVVVTGRYSAALANATR